MKQIPKIVFWVKCSFKAILNVYMKERDWKTEKQRDVYISIISFKDSSFIIQTLFP
jgi:hypothetical protein